MNPKWQKELEEKRIPYFREVKIRLSPGEYEELEQIHGFGSVEHIIEQNIHDYLYHNKGR